MVVPPYIYISQQQIMLIKIYNCENDLWDMVQNNGPWWVRIIFESFFNIIPKRIRDERTRSNPDSWQRQFFLSAVDFQYSSMVLYTVFVTEVSILRLFLQIFTSRICDDLGPRRSGFRLNSYLSNLLPSKTDLIT